MQTTYRVYTDGGARGNPGPSGIGVVITDDEGTVLKEVSKFIGHKTNNWAEYEAVIVALETLKRMLGSRSRQTHIDCKLDSELVARQLSGKYQVKEATLFPQFIKVHNFRVKDFPHVSFTHVRREANHHADRLANEAMDRGA